MNLTLVGIQIVIELLCGMYVLGDEGCTHKNGISMYFVHEYAACVAKVCNFGVVRHVQAYSLDQHCGECHITCLLPTGVQYI